MLGGKIDVLSFRERLAGESGRSKMGFTLIELLVVVAIIALLVGILIPSLSASRRRAKKTLCASNMRQIYMMTESYASEFNQKYPDYLTLGNFGFRVAPGLVAPNSTLPETLGLPAVLARIGLNSGEKTWICPEARDVDIIEYRNTYCWTINSGWNTSFGNMNLRQMYVDSAATNTMWIYCNYVYKPWISGVAKAAGDSASPYMYAAADRVYPHMTQKKQRCVHALRVNGTVDDWVIVP